LRTAQPARPSLRRVFGPLAFANLTYAVAQTLLIPALPSIQRHVHASPAGTTALASVFFLTGAVTASLVGRLGDLFGKQRVVVAQLTLFTTGALVCAVGNSLWVLIVGRAAMGMAAALFPLSASIVRDELSGATVSNAVAFLGGMIGFGAAIGQACGGVVTEHLSYHWVFWIPFGMGVCAVFAVVFFVPASSVKARGRVDYVGAVLLGVGLGFPLLAITRAADWGWAGSTTLVLIFVGLATLCLFVIHENRTSDPLLDIHTLADARIARVNGATFLVGFAMFGSSYIITQFLQEPTSSGYGFGASAAQASLYLIPGSILMLATAPLSGRISSRAGPKITLVVGTTLSVIALGLLAAFHSRHAELYFFLPINALGVGFSFAAIPLLILGVVAPGERGQATATNQVFRLVGSSIGTQLFATVITASAVHGGVPTEDGFVQVFVIEAVGALFAFLVALTIPTRGAARSPGAQPIEGVASAADLS
jgi:EmrB/QacA subfamily drug resistance transporter